MTTVVAATIASACAFASESRGRHQIDQLISDQEVHTLGHLQLNEWNKGMARYGIAAFSTHHLAPRCRKVPYLEAKCRV